MDDKRKSLGEPKTRSAPPPSFVEATTSAGPSQDSSSFQTRLACVALNKMDLIRFIGFSTPETNAIRGVLGSMWPIRGVRAYGGSVEIKFKGYPWKQKHDGEDNTRRLIRRMLEALYDMGWVLQAAVDVTHKELDKGMVAIGGDFAGSRGHDADSELAASLVFRYQNPPPPPRDWLSISFDRANKLKIVDAPPGDLTEALISEFRAKYRLKSRELESGRLKLKFHGQPWGDIWQTSGEDSVKSRMLLLSLLGILERFGYSLYASFDPMNSMDMQTDVLVVTRQKGWTPGMPLWHR